MSTIALDLISLINQIFEVGLLSYALCKIYPTETHPTHMFVCGISFKSGQLIIELFPDCTHM